MSTVFDHMAESYDSIFTYSQIGKLQRNRVQIYLERYLQTKFELNVLELNCGTAEDAIYFAEKGHKVLATDASRKMIQEGKKKIESKNLKEHIDLRVLPIKNVAQDTVGREYDLVFSNFGGFNCIDKDSIVNFANRLPCLLKPKGHFISILMPRNCLWENFYYLSRGSAKKAFRRKRKDVTLGDSNLKVHYFSTREFVRIFSKAFEVVAVRPIGFFLPPSYLESNFRKESKWLKMLNKWEVKVGNQSYLSNYSDHFLVDLQLKSV